MYYQDMKKYSREEHQANQPRCDTENRMLDGNTSWKQHQDMKKYAREEHQANQPRFDTENRKLDGSTSWKQHSNGQREHLSGGPKQRVPKSTILQVQKECLKAAASVSKKHNSKILKKPSEASKADDILLSSDTKVESESFEARSSNTTEFAISAEDHGNGFCESRKLDANIFEKAGNRNSFDEQFSERGQFLSSFRPTEDQSMRYPERSKNDEVGQGKNFVLFNQDTAVLESETRCNSYRFDEAPNQKRVELDPPNEWKYPSGDGSFAGRRTDNIALKQESEGGTGNCQISVPTHRSSAVEETLRKYQLPDLLRLDTSLMDSPVFFMYSAMLKFRILERILEFKYPVNEELKFLCAITDGNQTERNQRLITGRTCHVLNQVIETHPHLLNIQQMKQSYQEPDLKISNCFGMPRLPGSNPFPTSNYSSTLVSPDHLKSDNTWRSNDSVSGIPLFSNCPLPDTSQILPRQVPESENKSYNSNSLEESNFQTSLNTAKYSSILNENSVEQNINSVAITENFVDDDSGYSNSATLNNGMNTSDKGAVGVNAENSFKEPLGYIDTPVEKSKKGPLAKKPAFDDGERTFFHLSLVNLLQYDVALMNGDSLSDYAFSVKEKVLEIIHKLENPVKAKLELLCELTDGTQTERNQKLITARMCYLIDSFNVINSTCRSERNSYNGYSGSVSKPRNQHRNKK